MRAQVIAQVKDMDQAPYTPRPTDDRSPRSKYWKLFGLVTDGQKRD